MNNYLKAGVCIIITIFFANCINKKHLYKGNKIYSITASATVPPVYTLHEYTLSQGINGIVLEEKANLLLIKGATLTAANSTDNTSTYPTVPSLDKTNANYFSENINVHRFRYFDTKPVLQAMSIPLKVRSKLQQYGDTFANSAETKFDLGVAIGWKFTHNVYNKDKNIFGQNTNKWSIAPGGFVGTGAVELSAGNTRAVEKMKFPRKAPFISYGGFVMLGLNGLNVGFAFGWDKAYGSNSGDWVYQKKMWHGIILSVDISK